MSKDVKLVVEAHKSTLILGNDINQTFIEGSVSDKAKLRADFIRQKLEDGFLRDLIIKLKLNKKSIKEVKKEQFDLINKLVDSVTSEVGRAIVGLSLLQCCIKAICPEQ